MIQPPRLSLLAAAAVLLLGASAATAQELIQPLSVAGWEGGAYRRDDGRVLCAVWDQYAEGVGLWLGWDETGFYIDVVDPRLGLKPDHVYGATLQIDDRWRAEAEGYAIAADTIAITFGKDEAAISAFRGGKELYLPEIDRSYTLHGTKDAIAELLRCYRALQ
ncbi:MAG: hypothetical protein AB7F08_14250 [Dongiaceae bacterium]